MTLFKNYKIKNLSHSLFSNKGFTLVETIVGITVFIIISVSVYQVYFKVLDVVGASRIKIIAAAVANQEFEIIHNLPYASVGISGGIPNGILSASKTVVSGDQQFTVQTTVRNVDDPFDGTIGGTPNDLSPADHKLVQLAILCDTCKNFQSISFTTIVSPKNLETASTNGALFVQVFNANGKPVQGANVHIENNLEIPPIVINETTDNNGMLQIVDAPPGTEAYSIDVSKIGYSTDRTYPTGAPGNPSPIKPYSTVALQELTQASFTIDKTSLLNVSTVTDTCSVVDSIDFSMIGSKLIGSSPDIVKYNNNHMTDVLGTLSIGDLEWDTYDISITDAGYDLAGSMPITPFSLSPEASMNLKLIVIPKDPSSLLVTVRDAGTQLPLSDAVVDLNGGTATTTLITGRGFLRQTDWSGGDGQGNFTDPTKYFSSDGNIETASPAGEARLNNFFGDYVSSAELTSSSFDTGSPSNFYQIVWEPQDQPVEAGPDSIRFQIASNNDNATWNFLGPDGATTTYYTLADTNISSVHNGDRYFRYKLFLQTADTDFTPNLAEVAFTFTSACVPPGQVMFSKLNSGVYSLTVSKNGYQTFVDDVVNIFNPWQQRTVSLLPL